MKSSITRSLPPVPPLFAQKKASILAALATPEKEYTDLSPKGSVDEGIKNLINRINSIDGIVTTSSCAGRMSVFLEGSKTMTATNKGGNGGYEDHGHDTVAARKAPAVPGGKGLGGRWLFVSHEPVEVANSCDPHPKPIATLLGFAPHHFTAAPDPERSRLIKFQFEPMILHIMAASLDHAGLILTAAINAGFRESGVQSLKNLGDPNAFPMVAVRTTGLAASSIVGFLVENDDGEGSVVPIVNEDYLAMMLKVANARFKDNAVRIQRFSDGLNLEASGRRTERENKDSRTNRKREEGLNEKERSKEHNAGGEESDGGECGDDLLIDGLGMDAWGKRDSPESDFG